MVRAVTPRLAGTQRARPFVKWAGGKSQLLAALEHHWPATFGRYVEPFLGGGAVFFHLAPEEALLSDANAELIETWTVVRDQVDALIASLERHIWDESYFYELRAADATVLTPVERASRFIYLNKTCYNGLYRVNRSGQFNVPFGRYKKAPSIYDAENLCAASALLQSADLRVADFEVTMAEAGAGDFIYLDPPYDPVSATANFTHYTEGRFDAREQQRLARAVVTATERGAFVLLNNSDTEFIRSLFPGGLRVARHTLLPAGGYRVSSVETNRAINSDATKRKGAYELVVTNFQP